LITCYLKYIINEEKIEAFEDYAKTWIKLVNKFGGVHHGYLLPSEGASNIAIATFSFKSLSEYEMYREKSFEDKECQEAFEYAKKTKCILSYERSFFRPVFE